MAVSVSQCLVEFFSIVTRGPASGLTIDRTAQQVEQLARAWPVFNVTPQIAFEALRGVRDHQFSFWDAQIWAVARLKTTMATTSTGERQWGGSVSGE